MKRFLLIALGLAMIFTLVACNAKKEAVGSTESTIDSTEEPTEAPTEEIEQPLTNTEVKIAEHVDDIFRQLGRTYVKDNALNIDFACGGIEFSAECEGRVQVKITSARDTRFTVYVDGVRSDLRPQVTTSNSGGYFTIASDLPRGEHTFRLISQTQFIWTYGTMESVKLKGNFLPKPADRELYLEFYGDSILNGSNIYMGGSSVNNSDATLAFGFLTAEMMNADMSLIGCSSIGLTKNTRSFVMKDIWNYAGARYSAFNKNPEEHLLGGIPEWDFSRIPDVVIVEQGANDGTNASKQIFEDAVIEMINNLRSKYGKDVPIVFPTGYAAGDYNTALPKIVNKLGGESANLYICQMSNASVSKADGGDGVHPNVETAQKMAEELTAYLKELLK